MPRDGHGGRSSLSQPHVHHPQNDVPAAQLVLQGQLGVAVAALHAQLAKSTPYREDLKFGDDTQFAVDLWLKGARFTMIETPLAMYEDTAASAPGSSGARVTCRTVPRPASSSRPTAAASGGRRRLRVCAPLWPGSRKGPSR